MCLLFVCALSGVKKWIIKLWMYLQLNLHFTIIVTVLFFPVLLHPHLLLIEALSIPTQTLP